MCTKNLLSFCTITIIVQQYADWMGGPCHLIGSPAGHRLHSAYYSPDGSGIQTGSFPTSALQLDCTRAKLHKT